MNGPLNIKEVLAYALSIGNQIESLFTGFDKIIDAIYRIKNKSKQRRRAEQLQQIFIAMGSLARVRGLYGNQITDFLDSFGDPGYQPKQQWEQIKQEATSLISRLDQIDSYLDDLAKISPELAVSLTDLVADMKKLYLYIEKMEFPSSSEERAVLKKISKIIRKYKNQSVEMANRVSKLSH